MNLLEYLPHGLAIFWDDESYSFQNQIKQEIYDDHWFELLNAIQPLYPSGKIFLNKDLVFKSSKTILQKNYEIFVLDSDSEWDFFSKLHPLLPPIKFGNEDWDEVCFMYFRGLPPLLDKELTDTIWKRHIKYFSQYSYSENLPDGVVPTILTREFLNSLPKSWTGSSHDYFLKNINHYDVEIFFQKPDLRQFRISLYPNSLRSFHFIETIRTYFQKNPEKWKYDKLEQFIHDNPIFMRPSPSWIELEIFRGCELACSFCPRQFLKISGDGSFMSKEDISKIVQSKNSIPGEVSYQLGGLGEPLLHPNLAGVLETLLDTENLNEIIIETALYIEKEKLESLFKNLDESKKRKINFIVNLTTLQENKYKILYGKDIFKNVKDNIEILSQLFPKSQISMQLLKIKEVEDEVEKYFNYFEKQGFPIIFQKYNSYAGSLPEKRVSDLTPIKREFCWHLARDLYIQANGDVSICKQLPMGLSGELRSETDHTNSRAILGNIRNEDLSVIWSRGLQYFENSLRGDHDKIPAPCLSCDEWYTFNA